MKNILLKLIRKTKKEKTLEQITIDLLKTNEKIINSYYKK